jgi:hypothetical protein
MNSFNILLLNLIVDYHRIGQTLSVIFSEKSFCLQLSDVIDSVWAFCSDFYRFTRMVGQILRLWLDLNLQNLRFSQIFTDGSCPCPSLVCDNRRKSEQSVCGGTDRSDFHRTSRTKWTLSKCRRKSVIVGLLFFTGNVWPMFGFFPADEMAFHNTVVLGKCTHNKVVLWGNLMP